MSGIRRALSTLAALTAISGAYATSVAAQNQFDTARPHQVEGALASHYAAYVEDRRKDILALLGPDADEPLENGQAATIALGELAEMALTSQTDESVCTDLNSLLDAIDETSIARLHSAPARGHGSKGLDTIEVEAFSHLSTLYLERAARCERVHGSGNARSEAARDRLASLMDTIRGADLAGYRHIESAWEDRLARNYLASLLSNSGTDLSQDEALAASLLLRARIAANRGEYWLVQIYVGKAVPLVASFERDATITQALLIQIFALDHLTGETVFLWADKLTSAATPATLEQKHCSSVLHRNLDNGVSTQQYLSDADPVVCDQWVNEFTYRTNAEEIHVSRYRYFVKYAPEALGTLEGPLSILHAEMRSVQDRLEREFDLRAVAAEADIDGLAEVSQGYLDVLWARRNVADTDLEDAFTAAFGPGDDDEQAFRLIQFLNDRENDDAMLKNAAISFARSSGFADEVAELERLNAIDYHPAVIVGGTGPAGESDEEFERFHRDLSSLERRAEVLSELEARLPGYFDILNPQPLSLATVQQMLGPEEAVFALATTTMGTHSFLVTTDSYSWDFEATQADAIDRASERLLWDVFADVPVPDEVDAFWNEESKGKAVFSRSVAHNLYSLTLGRHEGLLKGKTRVFTLTNTGGLANLPFAMLVPEAPQGSDSDAEDLRETTWLGDRYELGKLPSLQTLKILRERGTTVSAKPIDAMFGIGDPALGGSARDRGVTDRRARRAQTRGVRDLSRVPFTEAPRLMSRLPGTRAELDALRTEFGGSEATILLGEQATEPGLRAIDLSDADLLVFATHGVMAHQLGGLNEAALILSPIDGADATNPNTDGVVTATEIAGLDLAAQWAVLSACNTATGENGSAPGLSGLSRAFFYAGVESILASLWPVDDKISPRLTVRTITGKRNSMSRGAALQAAMRDVREDKSYDAATISYAHPMYWAPFVLIGDVAD